jgi:hypothetical protein
MTERLPDAAVRAGYGAQPGFRAMPAGPHGAGTLAPKVHRLSVPRRGAPPAGAGRRLTGPVQGFGKMWQKTYRLDLGCAVSPQAAISAWKSHFADFWPSGSRLQGSLTGIRPGDVALLDVGLGGGVRLSTGVFVLYADEESFTLMTPEGHMFAGWVTFSATSAEDAGTHEPDGGEPARGTTVQAQLLMRANDPLYELALSLGGHRMEDQFWVQTMTALGKYLGAPPALVQARTVCVDPRRQWRRAGQVWHNSVVRTLLKAVAHPVRTAEGQAGP